MIDMSMAQAAKTETDHVVELDDDFAKTIGFTSDKFDGYLWRDGDRVMISFIVSRQQGKGHLSALFAAIEAKGFRVSVPTPLGHMQEILERKGFKPHYEPFNEEGCEVWERA